MAATAKIGTRHDQRRPLFAKVVGPQVLADNESTTRFIDIRFLAVAERLRMRNIRDAKPRKWVC
jgi:hypothetical protein